MRRMRYCFFLTVAALAWGLPATAQPVFKVEDTLGNPLFFVNANGTITLPTGAMNGYVLTSDATGNAAWMPASSGSLTLPFADTTNTAGAAFDFEDGVLVVTAGSPGATDASFSADGFEVRGAAGHGLYVGHADDDGVHVESAGDKAGYFNGDVEVTGKLIANPFGGVYAGKQAIYMNTTTSSIAQASCNIVSAACNDADDLPLQGVCSAAQSSDFVHRWKEAVNWDSLTEPAAFSCQICNVNQGAGNGTASILCVTVN